MTTIKRATHWANRLPIVPIVAVLLGLAVAFFCFAMPHDLIERLVAKSGLPALLPAAAPPLGFKAQLLLAIGAGFGSALGTWLAFVILFGGGRTAAKSPVVARHPGEFVTEPVRARRADAHPDAPAPRPIMAGAELGEPLDLVASLDQWDVAAEAAEPPASWQPAGDFELTEPLGLEIPEAEIVAEPATVAKPPIVIEPTAEPDPFEAEWMDLPETELAIPAPEPAPLPETLAAPLAEPLPAAEQVAPAPAPLAIDEHPAEAPASADAPAADMPSLTDLVARLERGLALRAAGQVAKVTPLRPAQPAAGNEGGVLRDALDELQRLAARQR